jgi:hypothetical protein
LETLAILTILIITLVVMGTLAILTILNMTLVVIGTSASAF